MTREASNPRATYRLQLSPTFGFADVAAIAPYLAELGVSHVYLSPVLQAAPGSTHGYDVVDHSRASDELGGDASFVAMVGVLRGHGLGVVVDVVPNHMAAVLPQNRWWWDVLENGPSSLWASFFDIDWDPPDQALRNRVLLPVLGQRYGRVLREREVSVGYDGRSFTACYFDQIFPLAPRSLDRLLYRAARLAASTELEFLASALGSLPPAWATDRDSVRRRHRDKSVLLDRVGSLYAHDAEVRAAIDRSVEDLNHDPAALDEILQRQNYRLAFWRTAAEHLDYRRFFDIDTLVALRVEDAEVFEETHSRIFDWMAAGLVDGLRVDHIDGLADPQGYLERVRDRSGSAWVVVEKILEGDERLPESWPVAGTTGYDFTNLVTKLFVDPAGEAPMTAALSRFTGDETDARAVIRAGKEQILDTSLGADLHRVVERVMRLVENEPALRDSTRSEVHAAIRALVVAFPVYRTYGAEIDVVERAASAARVLRPDIDLDLMEFLIDLLGGKDPHSEARVDAARRFQQLTGPVMAKGVEDTAFYRYHRLVAENEVGSDLATWSVSPAEWHEWCGLAALQRGGSMLATSTHDTKRSEDVRARLVVLSEIPDRWAAAVERWRRLTDRHWHGAEPDRSTEYLMYQTFVGAWPLSTDRAVDYARKATREAKVRTSWTDPDEAYDEALEAWVRETLADGDFVGDLETFVAPLVDAGRAVSLAMTLCHLTAPGVPDIYQGTELWDLSLVDPDNRRPVDYADRADRLRRADHPKLMVIQRALDLRRRRPWCFGPGAAYTPLDPGDDHALAFGRGRAGHDIEVAAIVPHLAFERVSDVSGVTVPGDWRDLLPPGFPVRLLERA